MSVVARACNLAGWEIVTLGSVISIDKTKNYNLLPYVGLEDISCDTGEFTGSTFPLQVKSNTFHFTPHHVLYGRLRAYLNKVLLPEFEGHCSTEIFPLLPCEKLHRDYLFHWLTWSETRDRIAATATGARMPRANMNVVLGFDIPLPPLEEQKRIVVVLDQAFAALDRAGANAEANLADAQEVLNNTLRAIFDELLPIATTMSLADAAVDFSRGKSKHRPRNDPALYDGDYPFIQTGDIRRATGNIREYSQTYNDAGLAQSKLWPVGTVCITIAANIAETGVLEFEGCFPDSVIGMVPNPGIANSYYVEYMLRYFAKELKIQGKGSAQDNINLATFENAKFPFPSLERQLGIVEKLDNIAADVDALRANYEAQLAALAALRQSLLQKAFAGQLT